LRYRVAITVRILAACCYDCQLDKVKAYDRIGHINHIHSGMSNYFQRGACPLPEILSAIPGWISETNQLDIKDQGCVRRNDTTSTLSSIP